MLHGWGSNPERWKPVLEKNTNIQLFIPYLPGFDPKNTIERPYDIEDYSIWLGEYIKKNNIQKPVLIGHSNGGRIAMYYCAKNPQVVQKLILVDTAGIPPKNSAKKLIFQTLAKTGKNLLKAISHRPVYRFFEKLIYRLAGESDYFTASPVMKKTMQNMLAYDIRQDLSKIAIPVLCIWGTHDKITPISMGNELVRLLPFSSLKTIDCGHNPHITNKRELSDIINDFIT